MKPPRSAALPVVVTILALVGVMLAMTSFKNTNVRFELNKPTAAEGLPFVRRGQMIDVAGTADSGGNPYRRINSVHVMLLTVAKAQRVHAPGVQVTGDRAIYDRASKRFSLRLALPEAVAQNDLYLAVEVEDVLARRYGPNQRPLVGNVLRLRVD
jgi:hypothetical protein